MSRRGAKAQGVALAGVAAVALVIGGVIYKESSSQPGRHRAPVLAALVSRSAHWPDGYHHFIVTVAVPTTASASSRRGRSADLEGAKSGPRPATSQAASSPTTSQAASSQAATSQAATSQASTERSQAGIPWQAVPPNPADPIVLRAGEPASLLPARLARYPKGTRLERDSEGNIRAVLPPGARAPAGAGASSGEPRGAGEPSGSPAGKLPPGWGPSSKAVVATLEALPGVHAASPVWGDKYEITTTLDRAQVAALPGVRGVVADNLLSFSSLPQTNDPDISQEYYLANNGQDILGQVGTVGASADLSYAWARSRGSGVVIADIDTGVDLANPGLAGQILPTSENFSVSPPTSDVQAVGTAPGFYHATTVDGVVAALAGGGVGGAGGAPEAKVLALKCSDGDLLSDACIYAAGEYAISQHASIINMSFGEQVASVGADPTLASLVQAAQSAHVLVTASAGNWGSNNDSSIVLPAGYASSYDNVISVGATDNKDDLASYSDYGATSVDLMAPGTDDFTTYPAYTGSPNAYASGTSYSAPLVAATAALLWSLDPSLTYSQVKTDILSSVQTVPALSGDCRTGGRLDAQAAVALVQEPVQWSFTGFDQVQPGQPAQVSIAASAQAGALPSGAALGYHLELVYDYSGSMYYVAQEQLDWSQGGGGQQAVQTGNDGTLFVAPAGTDSANYGTPLLLSVPSPGLAPGSYALVAYAATTSAPGAPIGKPQAVFFDVGQPSGPPVTTATTASGGGGGTTTSAPAVVDEGPGPTVVQSTTSTTGAGASTTASTTATGSSTTTSVPSGTSTTSGSPTTTALGPTTTSTAPAVTTTTTPAATTTTSAAATTTSAPAATTTTAAATTTTTGPTTTTTAPAGTTTTTAPASTTTTTAPASTTTAPGTTTTTAVACDGPFSLSSVVPSEIQASGGDVSLFGTGFPANPVVQVGSVGEPVNSASATDIEIWVGPMAAGSYGVTVYNSAQTQCAALPQALTIDPASGGTTTTQVGGATTSTTGQATTTTPAGSSTTVAATTTSTGAGGGTTTTAGGGTTTSTSGGATTTTGAGGGATTTSSTSGAGATTTTAQATTTGSGTVNGPGGMLLAPVSSNDALNGVSVGEWGAFTAAQLISDNRAAAGSPVEGVDVS